MRLHSRLRTTATLSLGMCALCLGMLLPGTASAITLIPPLYYDFGSSYVQSGYTGVLGSNIYSDAAGYGWSARGVSGVDRQCGTDSYLKRDFCSATSMTFKVNLNAGTYTLTVYHSNPLYYCSISYTMDNIEVSAEGVVQYTTGSIPAGTMESHTFTISVTDGQLTLYIRDAGGSDPNATIAGLDIISGGGSSNMSITGKVFSDKGTTKLAGARVFVSINGVSPGSSAVVDGGGQYSITGLSFSGASILTLFLKGATQGAVTVTRGSGSNMTGVSLYQNRLILRSNTGSSRWAPALTTANLDTANNASETGIDLLYFVQNNVFTMNAGELLVWTGSVFRPGKFVQLYDIDINGSLVLNTYSGSVVRNFDSVEGSFSGTGTLLFTNANTGGTITTTGDSLQHVSIGGLETIPRTNLLVWLDASDASTVSLNGTEVAFWRDKSGNKSNATTGNAAQPLYHIGGKNARNTLTFGASSGMTILNASIAAAPYSVYVVYNTTAATASRRAIQGTTNWLIGPYNGNDTFMTPNTVGAAANTPGVFVIADGTSDGSTVKFYLNGTDITSQNNVGNVPGGLCLGGYNGGGSCGAYSEPLQGDIAEVIVYTRVLSSSERTAIDCYLSNKWGITVSDTCTNVLSSGGYPTTLSGTYTLGSALDVNGNLTMKDRSALDVSASNYIITLSGSWINKTGTGGFIKRSGTGTLDGGDQTLSGYTLFHNLKKIVTAAKTLTFDPKGRVTVSGALVLRGAAGNLLSIRSLTNGTAGRIVLGGVSAVQNLIYLNVQDSNASGGQTLVCYTTTQGCVNSGNNTNWLFGTTNLKHWFQFLGF